jgi:hypothetical protein
VFGQIRQESDDVVFDFSLNLINAVDFELAVFPNRFGGTFGNNSKLRLRVTSVGFDLEPDTKFILGLPDFDHIWARIARNHEAVPETVV